MSKWANVTSCPTEKQVYVSRGKELGCGERNEYHCILNQIGAPGQLCIGRSWIQPGHCPEYNTISKRVDIFPCKEERGTCPPAVYWSNTSYQYSGCGLQKVNEKSSNSIQSTEFPVTQVVIAVVIFLLIVMAVVFCIIIRRRRKGNNTAVSYKKVLTSEENGEDNFSSLLEKAKTYLQEHKSDKSYLPTESATKIKNMIDAHSIAVIIGIVGSGKTKLALEAARQWIADDEKKRKCIVLDNKYVRSHFDWGSVGDICVVLDDFFTRWVLESTEGYLSTFCENMFKATEMYGVKVLATIDLYIFARHKTLLQGFKLIDAKLSLEISLGEKEKREMPKMHLQNGKLQVTAQSQQVTNHPTGNETLLKNSENKLNLNPSTSTNTHAGVGEQKANKSKYNQKDKTRDGDGNDEHEKLIVAKSAEEKDSSDSSEKTRSEYKPMKKSPQEAVEKSKKVGKSQTASVPDDIAATVDQNQEEMAISSRKGKMNDEMPPPSLSVTESKDFSSHKEILTKRDKKKLASKHSGVVGFPSKCYLFSNIQECNKQHGFFLRCELRLGSYLIEHLDEKQNAAYLLYATLKDGVIDVNDLDSDCYSNVTKELKDKKISVKDTLSEETLAQSAFFLHQNGVYKVCESAICEFMMKYMYKNTPQLLFKQSSADIVKNVFRGKTYKPEPGEFVLVPKDKKLGYLAERFAHLLNTHAELIHHPLMHDKKFKNEVQKIREMITEQTVS